MTTSENFCFLLHKILPDSKITIENFCHLLHTFLLDFQRTFGSSGDKLTFQSVLVRQWSMVYLGATLWTSQKQ